MDFRKFRHRRVGRRLDRRNAAKNIEYDATSCSSSGELLDTSSLDLYPYGFLEQTSFRIDGSMEGEVDLLCRSLGLSGPEDFGIPMDAWEVWAARKATASARSKSEHLQCSETLDYDTHPSPEEGSSVSIEVDVNNPTNLCEGERDTDDCDVVKSHFSDLEKGNSDVSCIGEECGALVDEASSIQIIVPDCGRGEDGGVNGVRPSPLLVMPHGIPILPPPPSISYSVPDINRSTWEIIRSFAPNIVDDSAVGEKRENLSSKDDDDRRVDLMGLRLDEISGESRGLSSLSTMNNDDASSTTTERVVVISPNGKFKRRIKFWMRGEHLGSGSFGTVYKVLDDEGAFFAMKEVSLADQGRNAKQSILQLEQEVALLSQFEHENIVQYYGTYKEDTTLYIILELATQGSLASLYQKYDLQDTHVAAYTSQILKGLAYLHDRNIVHRDIKCANILVHANGLVKLADFGLAKQITNFEGPKSCKGSIYWMAPEVVNPKKTYGRSADIWSLGCTVLEMLTRQVPYPNIEWTRAFYMIGNGNPPPIPNHLSSDARDFINRCVQVNPDDRPTAYQLMGHPFLKGKVSSSSELSGRT